MERFFLTSCVDLGKLSRVCRKPSPTCVFRTREAGSADREDLVRFLHSPDNQQGGERLAYSRQHAGFWEGKD